MHSPTIYKQSQKTHQYFFILILSFYFFVMCITDFSSIIRNLKNLADFSIVSKFNDGNTYRINYLTSNENVEHIEKLEKEYVCDGFTYVLKFYV